jgi:hypothetical protein
MFMNDATCKHPTFDNDIFRCGKIYYSNSLSLIISCKTFIPNCRFKNVFSAYFRNEITQQNVLMVFREYRTYVPIPHRSCLSHNQFYPLLGHEHSEQ